MTVSLQAQPPAKSGDLKLEPYVFENAKGEKIEAEFGRLTVPENRQKPNSRLIELAFVRFKSTSAHPGPPIIYLAGGPGGSGIGAAKGTRFPLFMAMREFGDVIALDQRGTGASKPNLGCRESFDFPLDRAGRPDELISISLERARSCTAYWNAQGVDLAGYNTNENADDIDALRRALRINKVSLWSISYGTHLALAFIKRHQSNVDRAILAGVNGLDDRRKLPGDVQSTLVRINQFVKADPELSKLVPDLLELMKTVFERLEKQPVTVELTDPNTKQKISVTIGKTDLQFLTAQGLGNIQAIKALPLMYYAMSKGDFQSFAPQLLAFRRSTIPSAMFFTMDCASGGSKARYAQIEREKGGTLLGNTINLMIADSCPAWNVPDLGNSFRAPVKSKSPVLLISGTLDGRTPPSRAEEVRKGFPNSTHLIIDGASHDDDLFLSTPQIKETMIKFMKGMKMTGIINVGVTPPFEFRKPPTPK